MVAPSFYNALYGINYRLPNVTFTTVVHVVKRGSNHDSIAMDNVTYLW